MKVYLLAVLLASFLMLAAATPHGVVVHHNSTSFSRLQARTTRILVLVGQNGVTMGGSRDQSGQFDSVIAALRTACPDNTANECENGPEGSWYISQWSQNFLKVEKARFGGNHEVYDILLDAVAGTVLAGVGKVVQGGCHDAGACSTFDRIHVAFDAFYLKVAIRSTRQGPYEHHCGDYLQDVNNKMEDLADRVGKVLGDGDVWWMSDCK